MIRCLFFLPGSFAVFSKQTLTDAEYKALVEKNAFNNMYPKVLLKDVDESLATMVKLFEELGCRTQECLADGFVFLIYDEMHFLHSKGKV